MKFCSVIKKLFPFLYTTPPEPFVQSAQINMNTTQNVGFEALYHLLVAMLTLGGGVQSMPVPTDVPMCTASEPAHYKLTFNGKWSRSAFPKQYPVYRPPAQWSNIVGKL